ncbi:hypothetical protein GOODEAATRI_009305 [Goodea atripinnis]|uniref:Amino acid transporter n=1 Tax=Goodea atripinnis TaxID=208336 RepID=A0ABV0PWK3_9TELE
MASMLIVLGSVGLPTEEISVLLMVDWILDRVLRAINVLGDCIGVGVVQHLSRHELQLSSPAGKDLVLEESQPLYKKYEHNYVMSFKKINVFFCVLLFLF